MNMQAQTLRRVGLNWYGALAVGIGLLIASVIGIIVLSSNDNTAGTVPDQVDIEAAPNYPMLELGPNHPDAFPCELERHHDQECVLDSSADIKTIVELGPNHPDAFPCELERHHDQECVLDSRTDIKTIVELGLNHPDAFPAD